MNILDYLVIYSLIVIWITIFMNVILVIAGYMYYSKVNKEYMYEELERYPFVSILVPAHNEAVVIKKTVISLLELDYPNDKYEIIVIMIIQATILKMYLKMSKKLIMAEIL